ncbi:MAG TPA: LacI family DNA-binding transcriptional regulator [Terriglobales bacterium]|nr:LacI family DNA-binding transcriptional regulator [Terriglobales bacterium]
MRPTMYTVANHAGVSIATVSRVLGGRGAPVREQTVRRVLASARAVGYRLNGAARALATQRHGAIGVVFPNLSGPYYAGVILGLEEAAQTLGQSVLIAATHGRPDAEDLVRGLATKVDGLVLFGRTVPDEAVTEFAAAMPVVLLGRPQVGSASTIRAENRASARALAGHLLGHGHTRIAFVGDPASSPDAGERWTGYQEALRGAAMRPPLAPETCAFREADGYRVAGLVLRRKRAPTALFCASDEIAMGACAAADALGLAVPQQVAITGWDDIPVARFVSPALTTVRQPLAQLGARAAALLQVGIDGPPGPGEVATLPTQLVIRASCGCPAADQRPTA